ncbi:MAG: HAD-IA family hydrolase [Desulfobacterales bacterium]|nr:HAD-IA family hydrolase [Desulfobacterales bacterium]MBF0395445.1 HAD-IA family hydrolase [Desulfobacterales bacterium]
MINIADRLFVPKNTKAILWDMDGVLLDSLTFDLTACNEILHKYIDKNVSLDKDFIRSIFAYHPEEFWRKIFDFVEKKYDMFLKQDIFKETLKIYNNSRNDSVFPINTGISEILIRAKDLSIKLAVVSNNPTEDVKKILQLAGIFKYFDIIIGNDISKLNKKPEPDTYLFAAEQLGLNPQECVVVEDSLLGAESGKRALCYTVGVATGGADFDALEKSKLSNCVYSSFVINKLDIKFGKVTNKKIFTPNDFVSHMIEHIAWRMCLEIDINWNNNNYFLLGKMLGSEIKKIHPQNFKGCAIGMIDDGSAEVLIDLSDKSELKVNSSSNIDLNWFMSLRCEQISSGKPLIEMLKGLSEGLFAKINIKICSIEDPHHTWEGVFRGIGISLNQIFTPKIVQNKNSDKLFNYGEFSRKTAESEVFVCVDFLRQIPMEYNFNLSKTVNINGLKDILSGLAREAGFNLKIDFNATKLSSSHVVLEDIGIVLGIVLKKILVFRMEHYGVNACGSSIFTEYSFTKDPICVGVSVEGRKFWKIVSFDDSFDDLKKDFIIGHNVSNGLFSEDLDDFIDGLASGLSCSIMIHIKKRINPDDGWKMIFKNLGKALKEVFEENSYRIGVPPGVKATLN